MKLLEKDLEEMMNFAALVSREAGKSLMVFYKSPLQFDLKSDGSPLTLADNASNDVIIQMLSEAGLPIVSEESPEVPFTSDYYWLVDPLDGTKDFLAATDHFTINIALVHLLKPVLGVVYAPALDELYTGMAGRGAWQEKGGVITLCNEGKRAAEARMAISFFHNTMETNIFAIENQITQSIAVGSALKYCWLAMGNFEVYPRLVGSSEWDTAAGQIILEAAGGSIITWNNLMPLEYGKEKRRNPAFIAFRGPYQKGDFIINSELINSENF